MDFLVLLEADFNMLESEGCGGSCSFVHPALLESEEADFDN